jgi:glutamate-ammonia-ligase adenylyltransferase
MIKVDDKINTALTKAWHRRSAESSLERWLEVSAREDWGDFSDKLPLLVSVFGASWYFTRYIFYLGRDIIPLFDNALTQRFDRPALLDRLGGMDAGIDLEQRLEQLRLLKNGVMLQILLAYLCGATSQPQVELALTHLAEATLMRMLEIFDLTGGSSQHRLAVLGMGRMAGYEMTFGSDLDLIFLYKDLSGDEGHALSRNIRLLLRHLAMASSAGNLYEVDMRLRPHGTSGALLTTVGSFLHYHAAEREIWERQVMTRCRPVIDQHGLGAAALDEIKPFIYCACAEAALRHEILAMRARVEQEKGRESGKFNVKQGRGGLMDIDFISHFFQLRYGGSDPDLQTCSTRKALEVLAGRALLAPEVSHELLAAYDFLKQVESCIRLFDMKSISSIARQAQANHPLAQALGYGNDVDGFMDKYQSVTDGVRQHFTELLGNLPK